MALLVSFIGHYIINLSIYCFITLFVVAVSFLWLNSQNDEPGIAAIIGLISWVISIISFAFISDPELDSSITARIFGTITGITANVLFILPAIVNSLKNLPKAVKERKEKRRIIKIELESTKPHISDL